MDYKHFTWINCTKSKELFKVTDMTGRKMSPKDIPILVPRTYECYFTWQKAIMVVNETKAASQLPLK